MAGWEDAGHPGAVLVSGSAGSGAGGVRGWGDSGRLVCRSDKNSSSKCAFSPRDFHLKSGFASPVPGCEGALPPPQNTRLRVMLPHLRASSLRRRQHPVGAPVPMPPSHPIHDAHPNLSPLPLPAIPWPTCRALAKLVSPQPGPLQGARRPLVCSQPSPSPRAAFTKYGRVFFASGFRHAGRGPRAQLSRC